MQHDETVLPKMLAMLKSENLDIVIGSRYINGGGMANWTKERIAASQGATRFAQGMTGVRVEDPMSGFFMVRREFFHKCVRRLNGRGFKILLDLLTSSPQPVKLKEVPYTFVPRLHGESKLSFVVILDYFALVFDKTLRRYPWLAWFLVFVLVLIGFCALGIKSNYCPLR
jgi:dolichol-phosphate mannosyltransferase